MWGPNPNRNPNYGGPWLWRVVTVMTIVTVLLLFMPREIKTVFFCVFFRSS